jgi:hypothetical protein
VGRAFLVFLLVLACAACGSPSKDLLSRPCDAGPDADVEPPPPFDAGPDADPTLGGPCVDDAQCDDKIACTYDRCDPVLERCRNIPDDSLCQDDSYCNGRERCVVGRGCAPGPVVTCQDGVSCTIDRCVEATKSCEHAVRDADGDGDPDDHCVAKADCDDTNPLVSSKVAEICNNGVDDNCDGRIDEQPCVNPAHDTCATALAVNAPGSYALPMAGAKRDYTASCNAFLATRDVVVAVTIPAGPPKDLEAWATAPAMGLGVAIQSTCGQTGTELACSGRFTASARARARSLAPGTYYVVVSTFSETTVNLKIDFLDASTKPQNESCTAPAPLAPDVPVTVSLVDPSPDLASACGPGIGELTYAFTLAAKSDVRLFASRLNGTGEPIVGLRTCAGPNDELRCRSTSAVPVYARGLDPGTYVATVSATTPMDVSLLLKTYPPTPAPADQTCASPPAAVVNDSESVDLTNHEDAIKDGCFAGAANGARALTLAQASDVMVIGRFAQNVSGSVSLDAPACDTGALMACALGQTPQRISKRNVPAGDYRVVISDTLGQVDQLTTLVRPTVPPTTVTGADGCANALTIPPTGGYFVGDTTNMAGDFDNACDAPGLPQGGAPDQVLRLDLAQPKRVVFNMDGSVYATILDIRTGATCPGQAVPNACYVGFTGARSFLDLQLRAGTYWIIVDGYNGQAGSWALDVRVLP